MKLHNETAEQIAKIINSINVHKHLADTDLDNSAYWMAKECQDIIKLADRFNIILPCYEQSVRMLKMSLYKDATLKVS